ncbi:MAG: hypothetical protein ACLR17_00645 [Enterobacteriaceae bacterium]
MGWPIKYRVSGPDYLKVREYAGRLAEAIGRSPLTREVNQTAGEPERTIVLQVNQTAARAAECHRRVWRRRLIPSGQARRSHR